MGIRATESGQPELPARLQAALGHGYRVRKEIGLGAFGTVYEVEDQPLRRLLAVKVLRHAVPDLVARFRREAVILANLRHPHIVPLHFVGAAEGLLFIVMPRLEGENLRAVIQHRAQIDFGEIVTITTAVSSALDAAHAANVVHRDVKPENIFLDGPERRVQLTDFGVAKVLENLSEGMTLGTIIGTAEYMSPEQCSGGALDGRSDVYSLGCVVYEMLVGFPPFTGRTPHEIFAKHLSQDPPKQRPRRPELTLTAEGCVLKALSKSPTDRFPTPGVFSQQLSDALGTRERRRWWRVWR